VVAVASVGKSPTLKSKSETLKRRRNMNKQEKINLLIKAQQLFTYEEWYAENRLAYTMGKNGRDPKKDYATYVEETLLTFPW
jgi:hypothetical protein